MAVKNQQREFARSAQYDADDRRCIQSADLLHGATKFAEEDRELDVQLPSASTAMPLTVKPKEIFINIDHNGRYFVDRREMDADEVETFLMRAAVTTR